VAGDDIVKYTDLIASYSADNTLGSIDDAVNVLSSIACGAYLYRTYFLQGYLDTQHQGALFATSELVLRTEIDTIAAALGGRLE
jgi:hypothetical protein